MYLNTFPNIFKISTYLSINIFKLNYILDIIFCSIIQDVNKLKVPTHQKNQSEKERMMELIFIETYGSALTGSEKAREKERKTEDSPKTER